MSLDWPWEVGLDLSIRMGPETAVSSGWLTNLGSLKEFGSDSPFGLD